MQSDKSNKHPETGDIVLIKGEAGDRLLLGLVVDLHQDKNGDIYVATIEYRRSVGGCLLQVKRHMGHLSPFMSRAEHQLANPEEGDVEKVDDLAGNLDQGPGQPLVHDDVGEEEYHDAQEEVG